MFKHNNIRIWIYKHDGKFKKIGGDAQLQKLQHIVIYCFGKDPKILKDIISLANDSY